MTELIARIRAWSHRGPWWQQWLKTALTHSAVVVACIFAGGLVGALCIVLDWLPAYLALVFPLAAFAKGEQFYGTRELPSFRLALEQRDWRMAIDSVTDYFAPLLFGTVAVYSVAALYMVL